MAKQIRKVPDYNEITYRLRAPGAYGYHSAQLLELDNGNHYIAWYSSPGKDSGGAWLDDLYFEISVKEWDHIWDMYSKETECYYSNDINCTIRLLEIFAKLGLTIDKLHAHSN